MEGRRVLIVTTSHATLGEGDHKTGVWLEELAVPFYALKDGGAEVTLASIRGGEIPFDPRSVPAEAGQGEGEQPAGQQEVPAAVRRFLDDPDAMAAARASRPLAEVAGEPHDAVFLPGGHGTMWDYPGNDDLALLVGSYFDDGRVVAAVCHGPAGLVDAKRADGQPVVAGKRVSGFTNSEEQGVGLADVVPFLLEDRLRELGGAYEKGPDWQPFAVRDGNLVTGQNPQSSDLVAHHVLAALGLGAGDEDQRVRERAYRIWEEEGRPHGRHEEHWQRARSETGSGLGAAAQGFREADRPGTGNPVEMEGASALDSRRTLGGAGTSGDLKTPRP